MNSSQPLAPWIQNLVELSATQLLNEGIFTEEELDQATKPIQTEGQNDVEKYSQYVNDPVGFAKDVLGVELVPLQQQALRLTLEPPYRVLMPSANEQGKSMCCSCAVLWWHCTRSPSIVITTAPTDKQVRSILWKEIRRLARNANLKLNFLPKACEIHRDSDDFAVGWTARDETAFQGQHGPSILFITDESTGLDGWVFEAIESMFSPPGHAWLAPFNPTQTGTAVHGEYLKASRSGAWHTTRMSALDHPNIAAELEGLPPKVPYAMRLEKFDRLLRSWSNLVGCKPGDPAQLATDLVWPPVNAIAYQQKTGRRPQVYRPGPLAEARLLGRYPRQGVNSVWSDGDWIVASREGIPPLAIPVRIPEIGCDVARFGDDFTAFHVRCGPKSLLHEEVNGQDTNTTTERLKVLARDYALWYNTAIGTLPEMGRPASITEFDIPIKIDDDGLGGGVTDNLRAAGYRVVPISAASKALDYGSFPRRRSELWFGTALRAREGDLDLSGLILDPETGLAQVDDIGQEIRLISAEAVDELKRQAMAATYSLDANARRVVCEKDEQKQTLGRSPDGMDAVNLAYAESPADNDAEPQVLFTRKGALAPHWQTQGGPPVATPGMAQKPGMRTMGTRLR